MHHFYRTRQERKSQKLKSGYVREPSGALTLTLLCCSYHTVSYTALHTDLKRMNGAIRPTQSYMTSRSTAITQCLFDFCSIKVNTFESFPYQSSVEKKKKNSGQCCFIYNTNEKAQSHRSCDVQQESAFTSPGPGDNRRSKSFFITVTPLFCSTTSAICSSPAAYQNCRALSGIYRWFTTVVCLNILSCTPLTSFTLKSLPFSDKSMGQPGSAGNFTLTHDTRVSPV